MAGDDTNGFTLEPPADTGGFSLAPPSQDTVTPRVANPNIPFVEAGERFWEHQKENAGEAASQISKAVKNRAPLSFGLGAFDYATSPIHSGVQTLVGDPVASATGSKGAGNVATTIAEMAPAGPGMVRAGVGVAKAAREALSIDLARKAISAVGDPTDLSILGQKIYNDIRPKFNTLVKQRRDEATKLSKAYLDQPEKVEESVANSYRGFLINKVATKARDLTPEQQKIIRDSWQRISNDPSMVRIENERRHLGEIASGDMQGYSATLKLFAGELRDGLTDILRQNVPASGKFIDAYREASEPINLFESTIGSKITEGASEYLPGVSKADPRVLPRAFFQSKRSVDLLKKFSGGDQKFVNDAAGEYAAMGLQDKSAADARTWYTKNKEWLDEVPTVKKEVEKYVDRLEKVTATRRRAKAIGLGAAIAGGLTQGYYSLRHLAESVF